MAFKDLLNNTCKIERLSGYSDYDFSSSDEGEVIETWSTITAAAVCRLDRHYTPTQRRQDGMVETGQGTLFVQATTDIRDGDRITINGQYYDVIDVATVDGMIDTHHKEVMVKFVDWS